MNKYEKAVSLWQSHKIENASDLDLYLDSFRILFAYNSGKIENKSISYHDTREIFENGKVLNFSGEPRTLFETENQKLCYEYLKNKIVDKESITLEFIKEVHKILTSGTYDEKRFIERGERPGEFKKYDYVTGINEVGSLPEDVEQDLQYLLDEICEYESKDVLKVAAYFHVRFEYIHPFADGNGRVGRTLLNYYLMIHSHPPMIIYEDDKSEYYAALESYDKDEEVKPMYDFMKTQVEKTWSKTLEREEKRSDKSR